MYLQVLNKIESYLNTTCSRKEDVFSEQVAPFAKSIKTDRRLIEKSLTTVISPNLELGLEFVSGLSKLHQYIDRKKVPAGVQWGAIEEPYDHIPVVNLPQIVTDMGSGSPGEFGFMASNEEPWYREDDSDAIIIYCNVAPFFPGFEVLNEVLKSFDCLSRIYLVLITKSELSKGTRRLLNRLSLHNNGQIFESTKDDGQIMDYYRGEFFKTARKTGITLGMGCMDILLTELLAVDFPIQEFQKILDRENTDGRRVLKEETLKDLYCINTVTSNNYIEFVGMDEVKTEVNKYLASMELAIKRKKKSLPGNIQRVLLFTGNPGTGKSQMARYIAMKAYEKNLIPSDRCEIMAASSLCGEYLGQTPAKVAEIFRSIKETGGVLVLDEIYSLNSNDIYSKQVVATLLTEIDALNNSSAGVILIMTGYKEDVFEWFKMNPGIESRCAGNIIHFPSYKEEELLEIFYATCNKHGYEINQDEVEDALLRYFTIAKKGKNFGNGRSVISLLLLAQSELAMRTVDEDACDITMLSKEDIQNAIEKSLNTMAKERMVGLV